MTRPCLAALALALALFGGAALAPFEARDPIIAAAVFVAGCWCLLMARPMK